MYLVLSPAQPALSVQDYRPVDTRASLPLAAEKPRPPTAPYKKDPTRLGLDARARAATVVDWDSGATLFEKNADDRLSIASITKLMTALVVLSDGVDLAKPVEILGSDHRPGGIPYVAPGEQVTVDDLLHLSLVASANNATVALARSSGKSLEEFAARMNAMAAEIGMRDAQFVEPTGLDPKNSASARDVAVLVRRALSDPKISEIATLRSYAFTAVTGRHHAVRSTDELFGSFLDKPPYTFLGGKTGYLDEAGYCFGAAAENGGNKVVAVVLGAGSRDERFKEVKSLLYWAFDAYEWPKVVGRP
jgi:D-alanyl-D-alanine endopeptidase (penicillin-binding protein 7)